ncbi:hypothetical protein PFAG_05762 [Plasmodium falciparum Santa Lucia]|uniref:Uncharacterized protein n=9 Tax=Plasmodium falciparum TaxID=5833 RepID=C6S3K1_PLAF7|nr:conserved Plasmodium protein, unknown function [Plasmodium falciparum 3D7]ETW15693.1 hypothetical protein PFFVO_05307 [Plasmodium falciparum Vietnam Oak-Knoll (FVO)]ETW33618.1 hypothetical protein PFTANZ_05654 [Plasmodium falciparum Tanzania (2000708)]ETW39574.1 hypothetical protein PFNF135_05604 [Plasmodium falciparum NF135/5.C10]ETW46604.1 hypothetical protein PFMALIP_05507 [Plasmodium falciparum MaliPS096_E11]EUR62022.1 hypothetical protein PFBG_05738 [Plasmodium falciparum 7G8]EUT79191|eukprot:XP_002585477.1 conserved Plasmodium protein, unknown function [Plasmodium falciparum 3D7]
MKLILFFLFYCIFKNTVLLQRTNDIPLINYEMIPLRRWQVSNKEFTKLKEKLKIFIASEIQKDKSILLRKYYKEFYIIDDNNNDIAPVENLYEEKNNNILRKKVSDINGLKNDKTIDVNGPILLI